MIGVAEQPRATPVTSAASPTPKITLAGVGMTYATRQGLVEALRDVNLTVPPGEFMCIVGPSGCGKSSLLRILAGITTQSAGEIAIARGADGQRSLHAIVFQEYTLFPWRTLLDNIAFGLEMRGVARKERLAIARDYLGKVGLTRFADAYPHQLSGGMKQRAAIARVLANDPEILLMDEPFGALDAQTRHVLQEELLRIWEAERKTVVYITHSIEEAVMLGDRIVLMTERPGHIKSIYPVALSGPRTLNLRTTVAFNQLVQAIWEDLVTEVNKARAQEWGEQDD